MRVRFNVISALLVFFLFTGCSSTNNPEDSLTSCQQQQQLAAELLKENVQVFQVGDEVTLVLPADKFFYPYSNHLRHSSYVVLAAIVNFINTYTVTAIQVNGYTDCVGDDIRNLALTRAQAQAIANYLWTNGLNARFITALGFGEANTVADNSYSAGRAANRRIEITFRLPPPDNVFH